MKKKVYDVLALLAAASGPKGHIPKALELLTTLILASSIWIRKAIY
jgi:hypothetical protein